MGSASDESMGGYMGFVLQIVREDYQQWTGYLHSWSPPYGAFSLDASVAIDNYTGPYYRDLQYMVTVVCELGFLIM